MWICIGACESLQTKILHPEKTQGHVSPPVNPHTPVWNFHRGVWSTKEYFLVSEKPQGHVGAPVVGQVGHTGMGNFHTPVRMCLEAKVAILRAHKAVWVPL